MWHLALLLSSLVGCANRYSEECFYRVGHGALGMSLWNQEGGVPKKVWEPLFYTDILLSSVKLWLTEYGMCCNYSALRQQHNIKTYIKFIQ
jgi:hypothetical protein